MIRIFIMVLLIGTGAFAHAEERIKLSFNNETVIVRLYDNAASKDFFSQLPMTLTFEDYINTEKIAYLPRKLSTQGLQNGGSGDFTYYAPWGNLAVFYKGNGGSAVIHLGEIESGKEALAAQRSHFTVCIEKIE